MTRFDKWVGYIRGALLAAFSANAAACSLAPSAYDLEEFLKERRPAMKVVALAKVVAVEDLQPRPRMVSEQRIQFEVLRSWQGDLQPPVYASIGIAVPAGTTCDGIGNLRMELQQTWLLVGTYEMGVLHLSSLKSKHLPDGVLPAATSTLLDRSK